MHIYYRISNNSYNKVKLQHAIKQYNVSTWEETFEILRKEYS